MFGNNAMLRIFLLLSLSLVATLGCKSSSVIRLRDRTAQKYEAAVPEAKVAVWHTPDSNHSEYKNETNLLFCSSGTSSCGPVGPLQPTWGPSRFTVKMGLRGSCFALSFPSSSARQLPRPPETQFSICSHRNPTLQPTSKLCESIDGQSKSSIIQIQRERRDLLNEVAQSAASFTAATGIPAENVSPIKNK